MFTLIDREEEGKTNQGGTDEEREEGHGGGSVKAKGAGEEGAEERDADQIKHIQTMIMSVLISTVHPPPPPSATVLNTEPLCHPSATPYYIFC